MLPVKLTDWGRGGGGAKSYDNKKAWSSINYSILSADNQRNAELSEITGVQQVAGATIIVGCS
jgi:hypothetical protein